MQGERVAALLGLCVMACVPLRDLDSASRGSGGALGQEQTMCRDGVVNGAESDVDCGGDACEKCLLGNVCRKDSDCSLGSCVEQHCQAAHCVDRKMSVGETDVDCGGSECSPCGVHQICRVALDCTSNVCAGGVCVATGCDDQRVDGSETDVDCGGGTCSACRLARRCVLGGDCESGVCLEGACSSSACGNGKLDSGELGIDCGGTCPKPCDPTCAGNSTASAGGALGCGAGGASTSVAGAPSGGSASGGAGQTVGGAATGGAPGTGGAFALGGARQAGGGAGGAAGSGGAPQAGSAAVGGVPSGGAGGAAGGSAAGSSGVDPTCAGCARLSVPLASAADKANFVILLPSQRSFSSAIVSLRVYVKAGSGGQLRAYIQHGGSPDYLQLFQDAPAELASLAGWRDIVWNVGAHETTYDKTIVGRIGVQISGAGATSWTNPTVVYVDSLSVTGTDTGPWTFDTSATVYSVSAISAAANVLFCNFGDSPVSGSKVTWYTH